MPPSRRRHLTPNAAALPASRLPLGTPQVATSRSPPHSRAISQASLHSPKHSFDESSDREIVDDQGAQAAATAGMSAPSSSDNLPTMSLAEAKLARQQKRIEQAEAAMHAPMPPGRERQVSRGKGKTVWMPFDFTANPTSTAQGGDSIMPAEVRVNTFRAPPTRDSSLSRSMSSLSQRTTGTLHSDAERQDSAQAEGGGFQLYLPRKSRKNIEQLNAYEDKPEPKQTTVEATVDTREIYEVFGNALPSLDFIHQNPGSKDGQLQFVQHPNGDVAAHQWSMERYVWENIGHFSNIRKKIEGQLAADRLKGETEYQTLLQNSLAYFRTIAKQREATAMGLPFGQKEIQVLIPDLRPAQPPPTAPKAPKAWNAATEAAMSEASHDTHDRSEDTAAPNSENQSGVNDQHFSYESYTGYGNHPAYATYGGGYGNAQHYPYGHQYQVPSVPRADRYSNNFFYGAPPQGMQDPFYSDSSYRGMYAGLPSSYGGHSTRANPAYAPSSSYAEQPQLHEKQSARSAAYRQTGGVQEKAQPLNYDYHFPPPGAGSKEARGAAGRDADEHSQQQSAYGSAAQGYGDLRMNVGDAQGKSSLAPAHSRTAMREQLVKLSSQAKERSLSQDKIRTVLNDPFRSHADAAAETTDKPEPAPRTAQKWDKMVVTPDITWNAPGIKGGLGATSVQIPQPSRADRSPELKKTVANPSGLPPRMQTSSASLQPTAQTFSSAVGGAAKLTPAGSLENFKSISYSSPDPYWSKRDPEGYAAHEEKLRDLLMGSMAAEPVESSTTAKKHAPPGTKKHDDELNDWWYNGTTFARHEDLYNSMMAANKDINASATNVNSPASLAPIGTPAKRSTNPTASADAAAAAAREALAKEKGDAMTRLLIPVWENLASYVQDPLEKRSDYFSPWTQAPEYAIDRSDNTTFYDKEWGQPPARVGRDPLRYRGPPTPQHQSPRYTTDGGGGRFGSAGATVGGAGGGVESVRFGGFSSPTAGSSLAVGAGLERRFAFGRT